MTALPHGFVVALRYEILKVLGQGGFGITYAARELSSGTIHALKEFFPDGLALRRRDGSVGSIAGKEELFKKYSRGFAEETEHLSKFDHPNIVPVLSRFGANKTYYFAMEFLRGATLNDDVARHGALSGLAVSLVAENLIEAIKTIHDQDLMHRDIKPGNIVLGEVVVPRPTRIAKVPEEIRMRYGKPVVLDFGAAREEGNDKTMLASEKFAAPEQFIAGGRLDRRLDIFGLGATLYFCLEGGNMPSALDRSAGQYLEPAVIRFADRAPRQRLRAIDKALELNPEQRHQTIRDFRAEFLSV